MLAALMTIVLAGGMNGSFAAPMSRVRGWQWEHTWLIWSILAMFVIPTSVMAATISNPGAVYRTAGPAAIVSTALYGMVWGAGTVLFGLGIARVGIALSFGIILGTSSSVGTLVPLLILRRGRALNHADLFVLMGAGFVLMGVAFSAWSGLLREATRPERVSRSSFVAGLIVCLLSGIGSSCMSLALNESTPISNAARALGASEMASLNPVWPILLGGGALVNVLYCILLLVRHRNLTLFKRLATTNAALVVLMAILWSGSNFVYGFGARGLGSLGLVVGWPIFMAVIVLSANAWGVLKGEWRSAGTSAVAWATAGCLLLIVGIWIVAWAGKTS